MPDKVIRQDTFTTRDLPEKHQFDYWREQIAPMIDVHEPMIRALAHPMRVLLPRLKDMTSARS